ncbi:dihydrofolate reductase family protein [Flavilitoribacter nigricans]|uniref:Dihydrofolate reductase n=1 Tax=Flavilitoribacter nigricans (strain ATCC 23147 / DSM 23189 / NBRC 102662 / NCIMB 1420 / SS-2) TaxID=1122177 RepID=A0A2D0N8M3_FLAN2|nr:dihydrofolate reductase family protein [Flavilitoribacter nigricans]PHN04837.1 dihydrofolate reductase [Flavilitoribacter nigricans DSM 23189 = NBRC 102662]
MRNITYHVATSLDHYIAHEDGSAGGFLPEGDHVAAYLAHLQDYDTVIMGRRTYEFGYDFGLEPGRPAYPHMQHYIFSKSLQLPDLSDQVEVIAEQPLDLIRSLKDGTGTDIYLCGGGEFAGWLLDEGLLDKLRIKLNPVVFGKGIPLFGSSQRAINLILTDTTVYHSGVLLLDYDVRYT